MSGNDELVRLLLQAGVGLLIFLAQRWLGRSQQVDQAIDRKIERETSPHTNGNGVAVVALATTGQAQQMILHDLSQKYDEILRRLEAISQADATWKQDDFARFRGEVTGRLQNLTGRVEVLERGKTGD